MDSDQPSHRSGDLFICFTSMKMSSRSILSPNRSNSREPPISLTTSLSRRLRTNRSIKGGASPAMFPSTGKKRNFENPEPSSPKVTCIGQVRVKSKRKKQGKRLRSLSTRRHNSFRDGFRKSTNLGSGYGSFGRNQVNIQEQSNNQRWVHLPMTICEALRAFGSEFSCLFPCRSSCFSSPAKEKEKVETEEGHRSSLCTRWLVVDGGRRDIELMVRDENENENENEEDNVRVSRRQHVFDDLEIVNNRIEGCKDESSSSRFSICIPPKNALLLMRCRSDPLKMEALANRLWESTINPNHDLDEDDYDDEIIQKTADFFEFEANQETELKPSIQEEKEQILEINEEKEKENEVDITFFGSLFDEIANQDEENEEFDEETEEIDDEMLEASELFEEGETGEESNIEKVNNLPECLLLMMCEPKLSMEVSKETWVSSKDFFRRQPNRKKPPPPPPTLPPVPIKPSNSQDASKVTATTFTNSTRYDKPSKSSGLVQPGRSSCSLPIRPSMAEILEQKLVNAVGYEPFVLTRCKSEPVRTAAAKLAPDTCYWKNRKLEPLRRATFGVGTAGIGV